MIRNSPAALVAPSVSSVFRKLAGSRNVWFMGRKEAARMGLLRSRRKPEIGLELPVWQRRRISRILVCGPAASSQIQCAKRSASAFELLCSSRFRIAAITFLRCRGLIARGHRVWQGYFRITQRRNALQDCVAAFQKRRAEHSSPQDFHTDALKKLQQDNRLPGATV